MEGKMPDRKERLVQIIQDMNFEAYGFSHEEVAVKTADKLISEGVMFRDEMLIILDKHFYPEAIPGEIVKELKDGWPE